MEAPLDQVLGHEAVDPEAETVGERTEPGLLPVSTRASSRCPSAKWALRGVDTLTDPPSPSSGWEIRGSHGW